MCFNLIIGIRWAYPPLLHPLLTILAYLHPSLSPTLKHPSGTHSPLSTLTHSFPTMLISYSRLLLLTFAHLHSLLPTLPHPPKPSFTHQHPPCPPTPTVIHSHSSLLTHPQPILSYLALLFTITLLTIIFCCYCGKDIPAHKHILLLFVAEERHWLFRVVI